MFSEHLFLVYNFITIHSNVLSHIETLNRASHTSVLAIIVAVDGDRVFALNQANIKLSGTASVADERHFFESIHIIYAL